MHSGVAGWERYRPAGQTASFCSSSAAVDRQKSRKVCEAFSYKGVLPSGPVTYRWQAFWLHQAAYKLVERSRLATTSHNRPATFTHWRLRPKLGNFAVTTGLHFPTTGYINTTIATSPISAVSAVAGVVAVALVHGSYALHSSSSSATESSSSSFYRLCFYWPSSASSSFPTRATLSWLLSYSFFSVEIRLTGT